MKIIITYFSQSGNTVKIAKSISEEASLAHEINFNKLEEIGAEDLAGYDFSIASHLHSANLAAPVKDC